MAFCVSALFDYVIFSNYYKLTTLKRAAAFQNLFLLLGLAGTKC